MPTYESTDSVRTTGVKKYACVHFEINKKNGQTN